MLGLSKKLDIINALTNVKFNVVLTFNIPFKNDILLFQNVILFFYSYSVSHACWILIGSQIFPRCHQHPRCFEVGGQRFRQEPFDIWCGCIQHVKGTWIRIWIFMVVDSGHAVTHERVICISQTPIRCKHGPFFQPPAFSKVIWPPREPFWIEEQHSVTADLKEREGVFISSWSIFETCGLRK